MKKDERQRRAAEARKLLDALDGPPPAPAVAKAPAASIPAAVPVPAPARGKKVRAGGKGGAKPVPAPDPERGDVPPPVTGDERIVLVDGRPAPYEGIPLAESLRPRKWAAGTLTRGQLVFYQGERYFIERAPLDWEDTGSVRITDHRPSDRYASGEIPKAMSFCVHADCLAEAPQPRSLYTSRLPTPASAERAVRTRAGLRDVGDDIATRLRGCATLDQVYAAAADYLQENVDALHGKYDKLNHGQQRMVLGNRMRSKWKKENV